MNIASPKFRSELKVIWRVCVLLVAFGVCLQAACMCLARVHPLLGLATHFAVHSLLGATVCLPLLLALRARLAASLVAISLACTLLVVRPWLLLPWAGEERPDLANEVSVLSWNVLESNPFPARIEQVIRTADVDVVVLIEIRPGMLEELTWLTEHYPHQLALPGWSGTGIGVFSRLPGTRLDVNAFGHAKQPGVVASIPSADGQTRLQLVGFHPLSPLPVRRARIRNRQLHCFTTWAQAQSGAVCLCGDLNTTPWDRPFQEILEVGFRDSRIGWGNGATWPAKLGVLGLPIDHALSNQDCAIGERQILRDSPGSDHSPLRFQVRF